MSKTVFIFLFFLVSLEGFAQDVHFSQFFNNPLYTNPADAGNFDADYRFIANERTQWRSVTRPYQTFAISADAKKIVKNKISAGFSLIYDKTGDSYFTTTQPMMSLSYALNLDTNKTLFFGLQPSLLNQRINFDELSFDNQYNGFFYNPNANNGESFGRTSLTSFNLGLGSSYAVQIEERKKITFGLGLFNLLTPKQSFFSNSEVRQDIRRTLYTTGQWKVSERTDVLPSIYVGAQGKFREVIFGGSARYVLNSNPLINQALYYGLYYRSKDAGYLFLGMDYGQWNFGMSYDLNLSGLKTASNGRGGLELSLRYLINTYKDIKGKRFISCPDFI